MNYYFAKNNFKLSFFIEVRHDLFIICLQLAHPILQSLKDTENSWMIDLLNAFNRGDIAV